MAGTTASRGGSERTFLSCHACRRIGLVDGCESVGYCTSELLRVRLRRASQIMYSSASLRRRFTRSFTDVLAEI